MIYQQRLATTKDAKVLSSLYKSFIEERVQREAGKSQPQLSQIKSDFNYLQYIEYQLKQPNHFCFILEEKNTSELVGFLLTYAYDESPPPDLEINVPFLENPFKPRRIGSVIGLYVKSEHRQPDNIYLLVETAIAKAKDLKLTDIELLIDVEEKGVQALLKRAGFLPTAIQYSKHFEVDKTDLPSLHHRHLVEEERENIKGKMSVFPIPLRDLKTKEIVKNPQGEDVFLEPLKDQDNNYLKNAQGMPIYPVPVKDPQTNNWVFNEQGKLVFCPILTDKKGNIIYDNKGMVQFCPPVYDRKKGKLQLKVDEEGNYVFAKSQTDTEGKILFSSQGKPIFLTNPN